jgi:hypothetical protein
MLQAQIPTQIRRYPFGARLAPWLVIGARAAWAGFPVGFSRAGFAPATCPLALQTPNVKWRSVGLEFRVNSGPTPNRIVNP